MQTFDQALYHHVKGGRITTDEAMRVASSPHDFKLLLQAEGRTGTTMEDVAQAQQWRDGQGGPNGASPPAPAASALAPSAPSSVA